MCSCPPSYLKTFKNQEFLGGIIKKNNLLKTFFVAYLKKVFLVTSDENLSTLNLVQQI